MGVQKGDMMAEVNIASILQGIPLAALAIDAKQRVSMMNAGAVSLLGEGLLDRHYITVLRQPALLEAVEAALTTRNTQISQFIVNESTQDALYKVSCAPIDENLTLLCFEDQSDREHVSQMRRDFVANVSHELKTPLTALLGFIETLNTSARSDASARERFLEIMEREAQRMNRLVSDLLSLSQVEAVERMRPNEVVDVSRLLQETVTTLAPVAEARGVRLHVVSADRLVEMAGDKDQLRQVFINLIENAIKYGGPNNEVSVTLSDISYQTRLGCEGIAISVVDKGPGIDALDIPRLTERFYRIDSHRSREMGGTGLGLAIVKHIVSRHRGVLKIDSAVGKGSEFKIILPI